MAVGLVALSSNNDHEESPKTDATKPENDLFENYKKTDLVLKTKHKKCLVCGVGDLVEKNSEKEKMVVYSRTGTFYAHHNNKINPPVFSPPLIFYIWIYLDKKKLIHLANFTHYPPPYN